MKAQNVITKRLNIRIPQHFVKNATEVQMDATDKEGQQT